LYEIPKLLTPLSWLSNDNLMGFLTASKAKICSLTEVPAGITSVMWVLSLEKTT